MWNLITLHANHVDGLEVNLLKLWPPAVWGFELWMSLQCRVFTVESVPLPCAWVSWDVPGNAGFPFVPVLS